MKGHLRTAVGIALSLLLLGWVLRDVSVTEVAHEIGQADPWLFLLSILVAIAGFGFRALRWGILLAPVAPAVSFRLRYASTIIGFAVNNLLPARVGEFARAFSLARLSRVSLGSSIATLVVERLFDGLALIFLLFMAMAAPSFPLEGEIGGVDPRDAARVVALVMAAGGAFLFALVVAPDRSAAIVGWVFHRLFPARLAEALMRALRSFLRGLAVLRDARLFFVSVGLAVGQWLFTAVSFLLAFRAFGIDSVPFAGAVFLQSLLSLAVAIPSSPGFFGPFEAAAVVGLGLWEVERDKAVSFAVGYHLGGFIPVTLMGIYYVWRLGLSWSDVSHGDDAVAEQVPDPALEGRSAPGV